MSGDMIKTNLQLFLLGVAGAWAATAGKWMLARGWITSDLEAQFVQYAPPAALAAAMSAWASRKVWLNKLQLIVAAATRNPCADYNAPETQAFIAAAIKDPKIPVTEKP